MKSMTGFGTGEGALGPGKFVLDARSVNHRYLDVRVRLPDAFGDQTLFVEQRARERLTRGRYDLAVRYEGPSVTAHLDFDRARSLYGELCKLRDELSPESDVPLGALLSLPGVYAASAGFDSRRIQAALADAFDGAVERLDEMREREGLALKGELSSRIAACRTLHAKIREKIPAAAVALAARVRARVERLLSDVSARLDPGRLEAEIALLAERSDVTEELVRLESHFAQAEHLLEAAGPAGRRLDFLFQEMAREANTVGAKCQEAELGHSVIELKSEIERMREQVQNVE